MDDPRQGAEHQGLALEGHRTRSRRVIGEVQADKIVVKGGRATFGYTLDEPSQGRVAVRVVLGGNVGWCADAPERPAATG